jgi:hypothetical protein
MKLKTLLSTTFSAIALMAAAPAMAGAVGDADPGYPGLNNGPSGPAAVVVPQSQFGQSENMNARAGMGSAMNPSMVANSHGDSQAQGRMFNGEAFYFPEPVGPGKTRAQVKAETLEAIRVGAISTSERYEFPTQQQLESIRMAGLRALDPTMAGKGTMPANN